jgi:serine protease Do
MKTRDEEESSDRLSDKSRIGLRLVLVVMFFLLGACKNNGTTPLPPQPTSNTGDAPVAHPVDSYADVVSRDAPAVVTIVSERRVRPPQQYPFLDDPFFRRFFGLPGPNTQQQPPELRERGLGSGVIVTADGYIVTNHHVIDGAEGIKVTLSDNRIFDAKVIGSDLPSDLAVLKIDAESLPILPLGDSDKVRVGDVALAIGSPLGLSQTVTAGIISAKGRTTGVSDGSFVDFLQTDAPINQGNSGGALINTRAELIGINSMIMSSTGGNIGIGFAIPANMTRNVMQQLIDTGRVRRAKLGVVVQAVTPDIAQKLGLPEVRGGLVAQVEPGSPAARAGIREGDVILALNGQPVNDGSNLRVMVANTQPGTEVTLTIFRDGHEQQVRATLEEFVPPQIAATG